MYRCSICSSLHLNSQQYIANYLEWNCSTFWTCNFWEIAIFWDKLITFMEHKCSSLVTICVSGMVRQGRNSSVGQFFFLYLKFSGKIWPQKRSWRIHCAFTFFLTLVIRYILQKRYVYTTFYVTGTKRCLCMSGYVTVQSADETKYMCGEYYSVTSCGRLSHGVQGHNTVWHHFDGQSIRVMEFWGIIQCDIVWADKSWGPRV